MGAVSAPTFGIHWFRRDLRLAENPALSWSLREHRGRVLGVFSFDRQFLSRSDFSPDRFAFFLSTLRALQIEFRERGGELLVLDGSPDDTFSKLFESLRVLKRPLPATLSFNRDYEPFARARDERVSRLMREKWGLVVHHERDHLLLEPHEVLKDDGKPYRVFTPYSRAWWAKFRSAAVQQRLEARAKPPPLRLSARDVFGRASPLEDKLAGYIEENAPKVRVSIPAAGAAEALKRVRQFKMKLDAYGSERDLPAVDGTSRLSYFMKNGSITTAQIINALDLDRPDLTARSGAAIFLKELIWREFYYSILFHYPNVEHQAFIEKYRSIQWPNDEKLFEAWKNGQTGYPIVDAGMRQLNQTGWMHNRLRMITASFLVKDLLVDWKWGERYFMERLLDGDLAPNNGGWQWSASTGCDPQPYFRIFNPALQSKRFDPDGEYIRKYVPELAKAPLKELNEPKDPVSRYVYPAPVVVHARQRDKAIALYTAAR